MSNITPDFPDWRRDVLTISHNVLNTVSDHWNATHDYGTFYVGDGRSLQVAWNEGNPGTIRTLAVAPFTGGLPTDGAYEYLLHNQGGLIVATLPIVSQTVDIIVDGGTVPAPTDTTLRVDVLRNETGRQLAVADLLVLEAAQNAVGAGASFTTLQKMVIPGRAQVTTGSSAGAHLCDVQYMTSTGAWRSCGSQAATTFVQTYSMIVPPAPLRMIITNQAGGAANLTGVIVHDAGG